MEQIINIMNIYTFMDTFAYRVLTEDSVGVSNEDLLREASVAKG